MKRLIALLLCLATVLCVFAGCAKNENYDEDMGAYIEMYLADQVYNFDPAQAYGNESALKIISLLYENLFVLGENGKPQKSLVKSYKIYKKDNTMMLKLRDDVKWSDGAAVDADDVVFAWQRILDSAKSFDAAVLLYEVKNAKAAKEGNVPSIDDVGIQALNSTEILIEFEEGVKVNYDNFIVNLTSYALCPVRSDAIDCVEKDIDWAKSTSTIVTSGPFKLRSVSYATDNQNIVLERNAYYKRDYMDDKIDKSVNPFRLIINYSKTDEQILADYEAGKIFYIGDIPYSIRSQHSAKEWNKIADITDSLSTHSYMFNLDAVVRYYDAEKFKSLSANTSVYDPNLVEGTDGDKIFAKKEVRTALSLAINRTDIANAVVFAEPANGIVPNGVFETNAKRKTFRDNDTEGLALTSNIEQAKSILASAGITPSKYMFAISVPAYDDVHMEIAKMVQKAWGKEGIGFNVAINAINTVDNQDIAITTGTVISGVKDDIFHENYISGNFEVAAIDYSALSPDAFSVLATFAKGYTGGASILPQTTEFSVATHISGFDNKEYNDKIAAAFAEKNLENRAKILHEAEDLLMKELPVIPIIYNKNAVLKSKQLSRVEYSYYQFPIFSNAKLKNYEKYIPEEK